MTLNCGFSNVSMSLTKKNNKKEKKKKRNWKEIQSSLAAAHQSVSATYGKAIPSYAPCHICILRIGSVPDTGPRSTIGSASDSSQRYRVRYPIRPHTFVSLSADSKRLGVS